MEREIKILNRKIKKLEKKKSKISKNLALLKFSKHELQCILDIERIKNDKL